MISGRAKDPVYLKIDDDERGWDVAAGTPGKEKLAELGLGHLKG